MYSIHSGTVTMGHGMASGRSIGKNGNPFPESTLRLQHPYFQQRGFDLNDALPCLHWGTVNLVIGRELVLGTPDVTLAGIDWTEALAASARIAPESFSFIRCCLAWRGSYHPGLIYYPHPETKPAEVAHRYDIIEVITCPVPDLAYGDEAAVLCRADAFAPRTI